MQEFTISHRDPALQSSVADRHTAKEPLTARGRAPGAETSSEWVEIVERFKNPLVNYLYRLSRCHATAEDLAQETFIRFFEHRDRYREQGTLSAYLYKIATNLARSHQRKNSRRVFLSSIFLPQNRDGHEPQQQRGVENRQLRSVLEREIAELPMDFRVPLVLAEIEGWPYQEIAEVLNCRPGTVKSRIHRAKKRLRARLGSWDPAAPDDKNHRTRPYEEPRHEAETP